MLEFQGNGTRIADRDIDEACAALGCLPAAVQAVIDVESSGSGFLGDNRPKILFESRWFHKLTDGQYDKSNPGISTPKWVRNYAGGVAEYDRLNEAIALDREAALKSSSWGKFQILGVNHRVCAHPSVEAFVAAHVESEREHLTAFVNFVKGNQLDDELRDRRWADFARRYNGPGFKQNRYDDRLAEAFTKHSSGIVPPSTQDVQLALNRFGAGLVADGISGPATKDAIKAFQKTQGLVPDGIAGPDTLAALGLADEADPLAISADINRA